MRRYTTKMMVSIALLAALVVVLARFMIPMLGPTVRFSIEAVPIIIGAYLFGPAAGMIIGFTGDLVGTFFTPYGYNPLFALPPILIGLCAGLMRRLVIRRFSYLRILLSFLPAVAFGSVLWQSYWLSVIYGTRSFSSFLALRSVQFAITSLINAAVIFGLFRTKVFEMLQLWPPAGFSATDSADTPEQGR